MLVVWELVKMQLEFVSFWVMEGDDVELFFEEIEVKKQNEIGGINFEYGKFFGEIFQYV